MLFDTTCVICHEDRLTFQKKKMVLGITLSPENYVCENCGSIFCEDELKWRLVQTKDKNNPIWKEFRQKSLYVREWLTIGNFDLDQNACGVA